MHTSCGRQNNLPVEVHALILRTCVSWYLTKQTLQMQLRLQIFRTRDYLDYPSEHNIIT